MVKALLRAGKKAKKAVKKAKRGTQDLFADRFVSQLDEGQAPSRGTLDVEAGRAGRVNLRTIEHKFKLNSYRHEDKQQIIKIQKELRTNRVAICKTQGYDEYYILPTAPKNSTESEELNIKEGAKTSSIKSAFTKSLKAKTVNRQLLNKFIGLVA